ncbi:malonate decarboxylase holo-ACP synthase [Granulicella mallensis]|uniref:Holo-ACP synthase, malonate decarboxylase-specific n=1 Tax=Granulicella mallensis (strain ATCC BAA-1857 / DSM 23137 / MP5ACTX8) TaxID=682795 RepID=G8NWE2_GRAMM|nr:malonate decarboxylase holo-ACP synthase [Granulicella mallensis]AEU37745.1 holo-ACP synthase, malonate decarboxylase-specific [Granulicella mallensis MP5ACTX8]
MAGAIDEAPQVHDLLLLSSGRVHPACMAEPPWVQTAMKHSPWVVVRRVNAPVGKVAVGVRGTDRSQRWGGFVDMADVALIKRPLQLRVSLAHDSRRSVPALKTLALVERELADIDLSWGPVGSVGFELATGDHVITEASDLDLALFAPQKIDHAIARDLWDTLSSLPAKVDVRIETPYCGFSLEEYALRRSAKILIRTPDGQQLVEDPWDIADEGRLK